MGFAAAPGSGGSSSCGASSPKIVLSRRIFFYPVLVVAYLCGKSQCQQIEVGETDCGTGFWRLVQDGAQLFIPALGSKW